MIACAVGAAGLCGCGPGQPYVTPDRLERGLVIVLSGIEGRSGYNEAICEGLDAGGVNWAIELHDWTGWGGPLYNLRNRAGNRRKAAGLAGRIARYQARYPHCPVVLVGQSGGGAMAVWTAEALPPEAPMDGLILLAVSLSPRYVPAAALHASRRGIVSFYSNKDWILLGTAVTGTMDGELASSAGRTGFAVPGGDGAIKPFDRLHQIAWNEKMAEAGHTGGHLTSGAAEFVATFVAPLVRERVWTGEVVGRAARGEPAVRPIAVPPRGPPRTEATTRPGKAPTMTEKDSTR